MELVECDCCALMVRKEDVIPVNVRLGTNTSRLMICSKCIRREQEAADKYIKKHYREDVDLDLENVTDEILRLRELLFTTQKVALKRNAEQIRGQAIDKILDAMLVVEALAKRASVDVEKGKADTTKARYYHLLGYLVQVLDSVLRSAGSGELDARLRAAEAVIREIKDREDKKA
ncbi:hypothetical protein KEJ39_04195 [Candidatus Bathyarchaeota archaeon]|nr:hypothetical protein [Candidatus Bathyarchaeota archaeon]